MRDVSRTSIDALVICDETGFPFLRKMDAALTSLLRLIDAGRTVRLIVPNPDIIYPDGIDSALVATGVSQAGLACVPARLRPMYWMPALRAD
ncbi:MAG TPA: hypothetical protein VFB20_06315 [Burkholderiales bacterium]|nr:hypothetical protein [Burkholderiales bacterium]